MKEIIEEYLKKLKQKYRTGQASEQSYYPVLEEFFGKLLKFYKIKGNVIAIAKREEDVGFPDFRINGEKYFRIGDVEAKDVFKDLNEVVKTEQLKKYIGSLDNLILTDYLKFWLYREKKRLRILELIESTEFERKHRFIVPDTEKVKEFFDFFFSYSIKDIHKPKDLAVELARRTKLLRINVKEILEIEVKEGKGKLFGIFEAFEKHLINDLKLDDFSDMYAQTITYGLLLAKIKSIGIFDRTNAHEHIPKSISLLNDLFWHLAERDLPEQLVGIVDDITNVLNASDIGNIEKEISQRTKSSRPILHFYETLLAQYDPKN